jgi:Domain of unknown function (DUF6531)
MNSFRTAARRAALAISLFAAIVFANTPTASAQTMTYFYIGQPYVNSLCLSAYGIPCNSGSITASFTLSVPAGYSGHVTGAAVTSYVMNASGVGSLSNLTYLNAGGSYFDLYLGQITNWQFQATNYNGTGNDLTITSTGPSQGETAEQRAAWNPVAAGAAPTATPTAAGAWINPKVLGRPARLPQIADATPAGPTAKPQFCPCSSLAQVGDPIDVGSGNVFEQVSDYETAGQNKLSFTRYYNSMAVPDAYATVLGQNCPIMTVICTLFQLRESKPSGRMARSSISPS